MKRSLLIDLDGVLRIGQKTANGLQEFFNYLTTTKINACILSNSTLLSSSDVKQFFQSKNVVCPLPVMTTVDGSIKFIQKNYRRVSVYCDDKVKHLFDEFDTTEQPEAVLIGDMGKKWTFEIINDIFRKVLDGADLLAMQLNKFWKTPDDGYLIDAGAFVKAIEYATSKKAKLIGKPSSLYFKSALELISENDPQNFIMLGDDLETDIKGATELGAESILIFTGKTACPLPSDSQIKPDYEAKDLFEVIELLKSFK